MNILKSAVLAGLTLGSTWCAQAKLVARWDFNNYDPANPTATNILAATVGDAGYPCYYAGKGGSALVTDGTLGQMYAVSADSTDANAVTAYNALGGGNYAIAIPAHAHVALPIPDAVKDHAWAMKMRCWIPAGSIWHSFMNRQNNTDGDYFVNRSNALGGGQFGGYGYAKSFSVGAWHTVTISGGPTRYEAFLDETTEANQYADGGKLKYFCDSKEALTTYNGKTCLLLSADNDGEDNLMYIDYVELYDTAAVYEGKLPHYSKEGLVGEWTFPADNPCKATVGQDLVKHTRAGAADFTPTTDCVLKGDTGVVAGQNNYFICNHQLPAGSSYTLVMDVRIPDTATKDKWYHGLFMSSTYTSDGLLWITPTKVGSGYYTVYAKRTASGGYFALNEWVRLTVVYAADKSVTIYQNGEKILSHDGYRGCYKPAKGGCFYLLGDNDGEDYDTEISYAAVYDRVLTANEVAELHARPLAQKADGTFIPTVAPAGIWQTQDDGLAALKGEPLVATEDGGYVWTRDAAPTAATYVFDLTLPETQTEGGTLVKNAASVASGVNGTTSAYAGSFTTTTDPSTFLSGQLSTWGYWTMNTLDRTTAHRVAVVWGNATGRVHYYVDGEAWGQLFPANGNTALVPSATMNFLNGLGATVTQVKAYDAALTPDEVASLGGVGYEPTPGTDAEITAWHDAPTGLRAAVDTVTFTVTATQEDGEYVSYDVDFGDGTAHGVSGLVASGTTLAFTHVYGDVGTYAPVVKAFTQSGAAASAALDAITTVSATKPAAEVLATWPWQQNIYTNRFTIMCEAKGEQTGLEVEWGANYENRAAMTYVVGNGGTYIYKAHVTVPAELVGTEVPYRLGFTGQALTFEDESEDTAGVAKLWKDEDADFSCSIWGDNQQGARDGDWDSDIYRYVRAMFTDMIARDVDFGISTGDMSSSADYENQIQPGVLVATDGIFGRTKPYYVAWGNHDTGCPDNKPYFETVAVDDPDYLSSEKGNGYLYRNNVLFIFIDQQLQGAAATKTWLANLLATDRAKAAKFRILIHHYPIYGECWGSLSQSLLATIKEGGVDIVFSGHMHGYERIEKDGFIQLTNGGMGYLDHTESIVNDYGEAMKVGGHQNVPYLWARQKSIAENDTLGLAEPVRMGCIQSYGELTVKDNVLTYTAHGFNADGSYIGDFDAFAVTSKTVAASAPAPAPTATYCKDNSSFAAFTAKPVTNAKWAEYKAAIGEPFSYPEGAGDCAVVNVSKTEIVAFCAWLNGEDGANGTYRLPTQAELETAFGGNLARDISEWTSTIDRDTGWCRILGGNTNAVAGTWCRAEDKSAIATADCHANYLGFRLATGAAPAEPVSPLAAPLAALAAIETPAEVYAWQDGALVDVTADWRAEMPAALAYDVPVIFTGAGELTFSNDNAIALNAGFAAPNSTKFYKLGTGDLTVKGAMKGGATTSQWGWYFRTYGTLALENVTFEGQSCGFATGDRALSLAGVNDFSGAVMPFGSGDNRVTNLVASTDSATLKLRQLRDYSATFVRIGEGVTVKAAEDFRIDGTWTVWVDGALDLNGMNVRGNNDPYYLGSGTIKTTYFGSYQNSYQHLGISNIVLNSSDPWRINRTKQGDFYFGYGPRVRITSLYPWTMDLVDRWKMPYYINPWMLTEDYEPVFAFAGDVTVAFNPTQCTAPLEVEEGTMLIKRLPTTGATATSGTGAWGIDDTLALSANQTITGAFRTGGTLSYTFGSSIAAGDWPVLYATGLAQGDIAVTTDADAKTWRVTEVWSGAGDLALRVDPAVEYAEYKGDGDVEGYTNAANWVCYNADGEIVEGQTPVSTTIVRISGTTAFTYPASLKSTFPIKGIEIAGDVALAGDCDWAVFGAIAIPEGRAIALGGHTLDAALTVAQVTSQVTGEGRVGIDVPAGTTETLTAYPWGIIKRGEGELQVRLAEVNAAITGTVSIVAGRLTLVNESGSALTNVLLEATTGIGGTLDLGGTVQTFTAAPAEVLIDDAYVINGELDLTAGGMWNWDLAGRTVTFGTNLVMTCNSYIHADGPEGGASNTITFRDGCEARLTSASTHYLGIFRSPRTYFNVLSKAKVYIKSNVRIACGTNTRTDITVDDAELWLDSNLDMGTRTSGSNNGSGYLTVKNGGLFSAPYINGPADTARAGGTGTITVQDATIRTRGFRLVANNGNTMPCSFDNAIIELSGTVNENEGLFYHCAPTIAAGGLTISNTVGTVTIGQELAGAGALTLAGTGTTKFTAAPTYTGATTVTGGTLDFGGLDHGSTALTVGAAGAYAAHAACVDEWTSVVFEAGASVVRPDDATRKEDAVITADSITGTPNVGARYKVKAEETEGVVTTLTIVYSNGLIFIVR